MAANLDLVFIICGMDRDFNPRRIERYLTLVYNCGIEPAVILTKSDLHENPDGFVHEVESVAFGVQVYSVSADDNETVHQLQTALSKGGTAALIGSSGAGKSTLAKSLLENEAYNLSFSVSATSRKIREGETDGKDYYFLSIDSFKSKIEDNEFLEWEEVYPQHYYGTLKIEVEKNRSMGKNVIFDVDVMGGLNIKRKYKDEAISIFIKPPSTEVLEERLKARNTDTTENIQKRLRKSKMEMVYARRYDHVIENNIEMSTNQIDWRSIRMKFCS
jgi:guanylate kinase